ncbi:GNAT family N-acetyltransferase [Companilactobacillus halodurans]|uniref:GNAT family N-acetyltransferase n=1 Tax=Companilactobacillus halodurans TaxID=2584183 RepID=A0A5P0ZWW7_9LACO|nr:GNAT family N-acetyltransferase [Companilactobacillus halodurans]MQS76254.1 GNAT family N-acetyltransferase [Companilactobacillus halodurans]MQS97395.1 GNAT family N-acetyltransferase [Companilactobacillus halodurans]
MALIYMRKGVMDDLDAIMEIIDSAKALLKADGSTQWQDGTPNREILLNDLRHGYVRVLVVDGKIAGTATLMTQKDPHYTKIYDGEWDDNKDRYATIHRIALSTKYRGMKLSKFFFSNLISDTYAQEIYHMRIDTHELNLRMQKLVSYFGFNYRGIIYVKTGSEGKRLAYELNMVQ